MNKEQLKRFEDSLVNTEDIYQEIAKNYLLSIKSKYNTKTMLSVDELLYKYSDYLEYEDLKLGESILRLFDL